jgi:hypothetical protein
MNSIQIIITVLGAIIATILSLCLFHKDKIRGLKVFYEFRESEKIANGVNINLYVKLLNHKGVPIQIYEIGLMTKRKALIIIYDNIEQPIKMEPNSEYIHKPFYLNKEIIDKCKLITKLYVKDISGKLLTKDFDTLERRLIYYLATGGINAGNAYQDYIDSRKKKPNKSTSAEY